MGCLKVFFSDENIFTVDAEVNWRNDLLAQDHEDVPTTSRMMFPANVHALSIVSGEGDISSPYFFKKVETIMKGGFTSGF